MDESRTPLEAVSFVNERPMTSMDEANLLEQVSHSLCSLKLKEEDSSVFSGPARNGLSEEDLHAHSDQYGPDSSAAHPGDMPCQQEQDCNRSDNKPSLDQQQKLQICFDFTKGMCSRGDKCKYSHDLVTIVNFNSKEKGICFDYLRNQCQRGLLCRFSHDLSNIAQQCQVFNGTETKGRTNAICYDFVKGVCQRGSECRYSHDLTLIASTARGGDSCTRSGEVCYDFLRGRCTRGAGCRYSHSMSFLPAGFMTNKEDGSHHLEGPSDSCSNGEPMRQAAMMMHQQALGPGHASAFATHPYMTAAPGLQEQGSGQSDRIMERKSFSSEPDRVDMPPCMWPNSTAMNGLTASGGVMQQQLAAAAGYGGFAQSHQHAHAAVNPGNGHAAAQYPQAATSNVYNAHLAQQHYQQHQAVVAARVMMQAEAAAGAAALYHHQQQEQSALVKQQQHFFMHQHQQRFAMYQQHCAMAAQQQQYMRPVATSADGQLGVGAPRGSHGTAPAMTPDAINAFLANLRCNTELDSQPLGQALNSWPGSTAQRQGNTQRVSSMPGTAPPAMPNHAVSGISDGGGSMPMPIPAQDVELMGGRDRASLPRPDSIPHPSLMPLLQEIWNKQ